MPTVATPPHPVNDGQGDFIVDPASMVGIVSSIVQILVALIGPDKAKEAIDYEVVQRAREAAAVANATADAAADAIERKRFGG